MADAHHGVQCAAYAKGSVENLVGWVKGSFFKQRRFLDDADLFTQLAEWRTEVNTERPCRANHVIPSVRLEEERPRLRPLKVAPADLALRVPIVVGPTAEVIHDTHPYSMSPEAIGIPGTLYLYRDRVRIVAGRFEVVHERRLWLPGAASWYGCGCGYRGPDASGGSENGSSVDHQPLMSAIVSSGS